MIYVLQSCRRMGRLSQQSCVKRCLQRLLWRTGRHFTPLDQQRSADGQQLLAQLSLIRVLYIFAGRQLYADVRHWLTLFQSLRGYTLTMKEVDLVRGQNVHQVFGTPSSRNSNRTAMTWPSLRLRATLTHGRGARGDTILGPNTSETSIPLLCGS